MCLSRLDTLRNADERFQTDMEKNLSERESGSEGARMVWTYDETG